MLPKYFKFSTDFAVGGGEGDGNSQTPVPASFICKHDMCLCQRN